jgi:hypothetical protein
MDRSQQLRLLMKQQQLQKSSKITDASILNGGAQLSVKDKVKTIKMRKTQQHATPSVPVAATKSKDIKQTISSTEKSHNMFSAKLPILLFDEESAVPITSSTSSYVSSPAKTSELEKSKNTIPAGFFDNPMEDMMKRGVDIKTFQQQVEASETTKVSDFLQEITIETAKVEDIDNIEDIDVNTIISQPIGSSGIDDEEEAKQLAYMAEYASLLQQSTQLHNKNIHIDTAIHEETAIFHEGGAIQQTASAATVQALYAQSRSSRQHKRHNLKSSEEDGRKDEKRFKLAVAEEESEEERVEYSPMAFF